MLSSLGTHLGSHRRLWVIVPVLVVILSGIAIPASAAQTGPNLAIDFTVAQYPISPYIYGMNWAGEDLAEDLGLPVHRWGGNAVTRYSWQNDTSNRAFDWFFENIPNENDNPGALPDGSDSDEFIDQNGRTETDTLLTIPMIGWTPKARQFDCGFRVSLYGAQQQTDQWQPDCGNGVATNGSNITGNDPHDTSVEIDETFVQAWMQHLITRYGNAANGGVKFYNLDNEPFLWNSTHRDVHPEPLSYDGIRDLTYQYAPAIKATDPNALILGPADWGWDAYFYSALDVAEGGDWWNHPQDRLAHGDVEFIQWYLQQMQAYEDAHGTRILDYVDEHFYPQNGVALNSNVDAATAAMRLRSTRALWDPTYVDESWIGEAVMLIPRMHQWVDDNYPGTKIAIGEYNWGALDHINGALAQADILGIFGRERVDLAALWTAPNFNDPAAFSFRMYLDYDGNNSHFGDSSVNATSDNQAKLAVYAASRTSDNALTIMVINKTNSDLTSTLTLNGYTPASAGHVYQYSAANLNSIQQLPDIAVSSTGFSMTYAAESITLIVVPIGTSGEGTELLVNGGFEDDVNLDNLPDSWTANNLVKDKRKCNTATKTFSHTGNCAFVFTGTAGAASSLGQAVDPSSLASGDLLTLSTWVTGKNVVAGGKLMMKLTFSDGSKEKLKVAIGTGTYDYQVALNVKQILFPSKTVTNIKVAVSVAASSGKFTVDDLSLVVNPASLVREQGEGLIPLPVPAELGRNTP